jgi:membrane protein implicated in regulation of membrane protease activity
MISATVRDLAIILLAMQALIVNILLGILIWQIWRMTKMMQNEVKPIIQDTQETISTVRGTAGFVSQNVVDPVVRANRTVFKWRGTLSALRNDLRRPGL